MPTNKKRIAVTVDDEMERAIYNMRKTDKYCRDSISEIVRRLIAEQLERNLAEQSGKTA